MASCILAEDKTGTCVTPTDAVGTCINPDDAGTTPVEPEDTDEGTELESDQTFISWKVTTKSIKDPADNNQYSFITRKTILQTSKVLDMAESLGWSFNTGTT